MATIAVSEGRATSSRNPWPAVVTLAIATSIAALQNTAVLPLLPSLQRDLNETLPAVTWTLTISLLVSAVATPLLSKLGDMYGRRLVIIGALALLTAGSVVAALAPSLPWLIAGRVLQGFVAALLPLSIGIVRDLLPPEQLATGIGVLSATMGVGGGGGMVMAGLVSGDYHTLFWIITVLGVVLGALVLALVRDTGTPGRGRPDLLGALLMTVGLVALLLAISQGRAWGWTSPAVLGLLAVVVVSAVAWVAVERRVAEPLVEMSMLTHRGTVGATVSSMLLGFAFFGGMTGISNFTQAPEGAGYGFGASTLEVGFFLLPITVVMLVISLFSGRLMRRFRASSMVSAGSAIVAVGALWLVLWHGTAFDIYLASSVLGLGIGIGYAALGTMAVEHVEPGKTALAAGVNALVRIFGGCVSGAAVAAILAALPGESGYRWVFVLTALGALAASAFAAAFGRLNRRTPARIG
ncbi:MFS transporter [Spongiactinospora sp. TRM90649]|uniref:MFS transporter n=1 Tax=Spongiactinospora sp. TRM90649 TaxID=3031114 RepID=UPI0023F956BB|nr:MFS transporter [Spongiactinospora sp. TRM90649]MDF5757799.1 MFS transporter [Spongiactinospora sp. TRM90649]